MKKIEKLTAEQEARFPEFIDKWTRIGLCTDPADRARAENGVRVAYKQAKLPAPRIVWCSSPLAMAFTRAIVEKIAKDPKEFLGASVRASVGASVWDSVGASVRASVGASVWDSVWASVGDSVWASVRASVRASVGDSVRASVGDSVGAMPNQSGYGQHDASWLGFYDFFSSVLGLTKQTDALEGLNEIAQSAGWFLPHAHICWVSERHCIVRQDDRHRLHCETGPAVCYPDGWDMYAWHGTRIPKEWIDDRPSLTADKALTWKNIEQRRAACEILGWTKILSALNARTIDKDADPEIGELVEVDIPEIGRERFLRVLCGTKREFALPVPPDMTTALAANAWGYDIPADLLKHKEFRT